MLYCAECFVPEIPDVDINAWWLLNYSRKLGVIEDWVAANYEARFGSIMPAHGIPRTSNPPLIAVCYLAEDESGPKAPAYQKPGYWD